MITTPGGNPEKVNPPSSTDGAEARILGASETCNTVEEQNMPSPPAHTSLTSELHNMEVCDKNDDVQMSKHRPRPSGAQRKRLSALLKKGIPYEEALVKSRIPNHPANSKAPKPSTSGSARGVGTTQVKSNRTGESYKDALSSIRVAITHAEYPARILSIEQLDGIKNTLSVLLWSSGNPTPLQFNDCVYRNGYIVFLCIDQFTADWTLKSTSLPGLEEMNLKALLEGDIPKGKILDGFFPEMANHPVDEVITGLTIQNPLLKIDNWRLLSSVTAGKGLRLTFSVEPVSLAILEKRKMNLNFKFTQIKLKEARNYAKPRIPKPNPQKQKLIKTTKASRGITIPIDKATKTTIEQDSQAECSKGKITKVINTQSTVKTATTNNVKKVTISEPERPNRRSSTSSTGSMTTRSKSGLDKTT